MNSSEVTEEKCEDVGWGGSQSFISGDVFVMYGVAFLLDLIGLICFVLTLTVVLAPVAVIIQGITALMGKLIFTFWIVFFRHHRTGSVFWKSVKRAGASSVKKARTAYRTIRRSQAKRRATREEEQSKKDSAEKTSSTDPDQAEYSYQPTEESIATTQKSSSSEKTSVAEAEYHDQPSEYQYDDEGRSDVPVESENSQQKDSLLWKWLKRVFLPFIIESIPILGKIMFSWVMVVYLEDKNG